MGWARRTTEDRGALLLCLGLYALVVLFTPLLHHDFACHLKSPTHCTACTANPLAPRLGQALSLEAQSLPDAGRIQPLAQACAAVLPQPRVAGRSPPL